MTPRQFAEHSEARRSAALKAAVAEKCAGKTDKETIGRIAAIDENAKEYTVHLATATGIKSVAVTK